MDVFLELQTAKPGELREALTAKAPGGTDAKVADDVYLRFDGIESQRGEATLVIFALTFPMGIATNVIADLISQFLRRRNAHENIDRAFFVFEEEEWVDSDGNRRTKKTTKRLEIPIS
jgi:hypothetical protein